ncbi:MAG: Thioredoxin [uncultured bacterium]|nr:MAG: Thioredoxin [uncultured bacterium]OGJ47901.1 MAG: thioredoxin [Candidatus Peregrinibacteria bacterium RIFOXYA2_FULL_41_18]OGJ49121.1 MAG: thioredoxin [Candidatus Peregrinibacteria bacterium RIFOXYB12_FULL_41_12]
MAHIFTSDTFKQEVLNGKGLAVVDFYADWCGPCRMLAPIIDELSAAYPDVKIGKVNVDESGDLAGQYGVMSIPTIIFFKDGQVVHQATGVKSKADLEAKIKELK